MEPKVLIPVDDSLTAQNTIAAVIELAERFPKKLTLMHVINQDQLAYKMIPDFQLKMVKENAQKSGRLMLKKYSDQLHNAGFVCDSILETGGPRESITQIANEQNFKLLVIGRHEGGGEIRDVLFGSVANHVLHNVRCPVLLF